MIVTKAVFARASARFVAGLAACLAACTLALTAHAKPPIEAYGEMPALRAAQLSPDGKRIAFLSRINDDDYLFLYDTQTQKTQPLGIVTNANAKYLRFVSNDFVVLIASKTMNARDVTFRFAKSAAFSVNLKTGEINQLLHNTPGMFINQSNLGSVVGVLPDGKSVFVPVFMGPSFKPPPLELMRVDLATGKGSRVRGFAGDFTTLDWFIDAAGKVVAREDFSEHRETYEVSVYNDDKRRVVLEQKVLDTDDIEMSPVGLSSTGDALVMLRKEDSGVHTFRELDIATGRLREDKDEAVAASAASGNITVREIDGVLSDDNRIVHGVVYAGLHPTYRMNDPAVDAVIKSVADQFPGASTFLTSWTKDWSRLLFLVEGGGAAEEYYIFDRPTNALSLFAAARPKIEPADVGQVTPIEYRARDGLVIPALITWPAHVAPDKREKLPLVVLPHGGPESYDSIGFDWLAQFIANEGYMVLQPNFRGSAGFGREFREKGRLQWGRAMQDDITDGVKEMARLGLADPDRTCIVGWSYGGYAALAGGALTPDLYKCVAAIAGVSDLRRMLEWEKQRYGREYSPYQYWVKLIGDPDKDAAAIDAVSPARLADRFKAPVLLVHGADDLVVPVEQSNIMGDALRRAGKDVSYIRLKGDDHSLVRNESRREAFTALADFLKARLGPAQ